MIDILTSEILLSSSDGFQLEKYWKKRDHNQDSLDRYIALFSAINVLFKCSKKKSPADKPVNQIYKSKTLKKHPEWTFNLNAFLADLENFLQHSPLATDPDNTKIFDLIEQINTLQINIPATTIAILTKHCEQHPAWQHDPLNNLDYLLIMAIAGQPIEKPLQIILNNIDKRWSLNQQMKKQIIAQAIFAAAIHDANHETSLPMTLLNNLFNHCEKIFLPEQQDKKSSGLTLFQHTLKMTAPDTNINKRYNQLKRVQQSLLYFEKVKGFAINPRLHHLMKQQNSTKNFSTKTQKKLFKYFNKLSYRVEKNIDPLNAGLILDLVFYDENHKIICAVEHQDLATHFKRLNNQNGYSLHERTNVEKLTYQLTLKLPFPVFFVNSADIFLPFSNCQEAILQLKKLIDDEFEGMNSDQLLPEDELDLIEDQEAENIIIQSELIDTESASEESALTTEQDLEDFTENTDEELTDQAEKDDAENHQEETENESEDSIHEKIEARSETELTKEAVETYTLIETDENALHHAEKIEDDESKESETGDDQDEKDSDELDPLTIADLVFDMLIEKLEAIIKEAQSQMPEEVVEEEDANVETVKNSPVATNDDSIEQKENLDDQNDNTNKFSA